MPRYTFHSSFFFLSPLYNFRFFSRQIKCQEIIGLSNTVLDEKTDVLFEYIFLIDPFWTLLHLLSRADLFFGEPPPCILRMICTEITIPSPRLRIIRTPQELVVWRLQKRSRSLPFLWIAAVRLCICQPNNNLRQKKKTLMGCWKNTTRNFNSQPLGLELLIGVSWNGTVGKGTRNRKNWLNREITHTYFFSW